MSKKNTSPGASPGIPLFGEEQQRVLAFLFIHGRTSRSALVADADLAMGPHALDVVRRLPAGIVYETSEGWDLTRPARELAMLCRNLVSLHEAPRSEELPVCTCGKGFAGVCPCEVANG